MADYLQDTEYVNSRDRGKLWGMISLFSFWPYFMVGMLAGYVMEQIGINLRYIIYWMLLTAPLAFVLAVYAMRRARFWQKRAIAIRDNLSGKGN